ncbi:hypothetical protein B0H10DRAFT_1955190 [Mycena sp. CBHHK59/15]|nr:hypothetical protein B0H10DRAFT_1955190 [Mycena sp. CBHHK59/15]
MAIFVGPTHTGKLEIIQAIASIVPGSIATISTSSIVGEFDSPSHDTMAAMAGHHIVTMGEVNFTKCMANIHMIKTLVGHDSVPTTPVLTKYMLAVCCVCRGPHSRNMAASPLNARAVGVRHGEGAMVLATSNIARPLDLSKQL